MTTYKDYSPIVASFLYQMVKGGWKVSEVIGGTTINLMHKSKQEAKKIAQTEIMAVENSTVTFSKKGKSGYTMRIVALILLGNDADELVADWTYSSSNANNDFEIYWNKFRKIWEDKKIPTKETI